MKGAGLVILWLARVVEVGLKNSNLHTPKFVQSPVNQTCQCTCNCIQPPGFSGILAFECFAGTLGSLLCWKLLTWICASSDYESRPSPRRRGAGVVTVPTRTAPCCMVQ